MTDDQSTDQTTPVRLRNIFSATLTDEPALTDLVPDAVSGARARQRRERIAYAATPLAILGLAVGAYAVVPPGGHGTKDGGSSPVSGKTPGAHPTSKPVPKSTSTPKAADTSEHPASDGIPPLRDLFAHPGTPEENCRATFPDPANLNVVAPDQAKERAKCVTYLSALRSLLPNDTVVLDHEFRPVSSAGIDVLMGSHDITSAAPGTKLTALAGDIVRVLNDPDSPDNGASPQNFLIKTPTGESALWFSDGPGEGGVKSGTGDCHDGKSGGTTSKPCSTVTLADGTPATYVAYPNGVIQIVVNSDPYGNQFWFMVGPSDRDAFGNTYQDGNTGRWMDLATGTVHDGNRGVANAFTKDDLLSLTSSQGFLTLYKQIAKDSAGH
ncbi:MAG: hypothetical protein HOV87_33370 [Catenulispora sp.]|nr:hypothetical protein [Catenulispora sp.]